MPEGLVEAEHSFFFSPEERSGRAEPQALDCLPSEERSGRAETTGLGLPSITLSIARKARHRPWGPYQEGNQGVRRAASMRMCEQGLFAHGVLI
jgi:hypothetical protein